MQASSTRFAQAARRYLARRALCRRRIPSPPSAELGLAVVIPSRDEPQLLQTLESLHRCEQPQCKVEVVVVINTAADDERAIKQRAKATLRTARLWAARHRREGLTFHFLHFPQLPPRTAGVGLARKLGMDEATARLASTGNDDGIIACLDADCVCDDNYLTALFAHFQGHPRTPGCSVYFEHPLQGPLAPSLYEGIAHYELYLRYYVQGLRHAGLPFAFHTVGSCMAVRASAYVAQGGMNRRQGGEDFYFLQKIIALGGYTNLCATRVVPSPRVSHRVPFGTGRAMRSWLEDANEVTRVYCPDVFRDLAALQRSVERLYQNAPRDRTLLGALPAPMASYLESIGVREELARLQRHTASADSFRRQFFHWFNGFKTLKFIKHAHDTGYAKVSVSEAAVQVLRWRNDDSCLDTNTVRDLLSKLRAIDRCD